MKADSDELAAVAVRLTAQEMNGTPHYTWTFLRRLSEEFPSGLEMELGQEGTIAPRVAVPVANEYRMTSAASRAAVHLAVEARTLGRGYVIAEPPTGRLNARHALTSSASLEFRVSVPVLTQLSEQDVEVAGARTLPLESEGPFHVVDNEWARVKSWNDTQDLVEETLGVPSSSVLQRLRASLAAEAERWGRRIEDVVAGIRAELEKTLQPFPTPQLATGATRTRGASRVRGPLIKGVVEAGTGPEAGSLDIQLTRGPELHAGRLMFAATADSALAGRVARVVLGVGDYEVTLVDAPIEEDRGGGRIHVDCPLGDLVLHLADGQLPAGAFRVIVMTPEQANARPLGTGTVRTQRA